MNRHPFTPPETYQYMQYSNDVGQGVIALTQEGVGIAVESMRELNIPILPEAWKVAIQEVRMKRAEVRVAAKADRAKKDWNKTWLMSVDW